MKQNNESWQVTQAAIKLAGDGQERRCNGWKEQATDYLKTYAMMAFQFTAEDVIQASAGLVPEPDEKRAWGSIFQSASKNGIIEKVGYQPMKGIKAHRKPTTLWQSKISL